MSATQDAGNRVKKLLLAILMTPMVFAALETHGQSKAQFKKILDVDSESTFRGVRLKPKFGVGGHLCRLKLLPSTGSENQTEHARVSGRTTEEILDLLIPASERGNRTDRWGIGMFLGQVYLVPYQFDNVSVAMSGHIFSKAGGRLARGSAILEPETNAMFPSAEMVTITWTKRNCS